MKLKTLAAVACFAASSFVVPAMAATQTFNIAGFSAADADLTKLLTVQQFDTHLGTLNAISITYSTSVEGSAWLTNTKSRDKDVDLVLSAGSKLELPGGVPVGSDSAGLLFGTYTAAANTSGVLAGSNTVTLTINGNVDSSYFNLFQGTGSVTGPLAITASSDVDSPSGVSVDFLTKATGLGGTITYDYTVAAVPEPETYGMMLLGLGMVAFAAKRKARSVKA